jgi:WD40 repeat protein
MTANLAETAASLHPSVVHVLGDLRGRIDGDLLALQFTADGSLVAVEEGGVFRRWDGATLELLESTPLGDDETVYCFSPDGRWLAGGGRSLSLWNVARAPTPVAAADDGWATSLAFSPNGAALAVGCDDGRIRFWSVPDFKPRLTLSDSQGPISALAFSDDGFLLASADERRRIAIWGWEEEVLLRTLVGSTDRIDALSWSPDGRRLASAGWDRSVRLWDLRKGELAAMLNDHAPRVHAAAFVPGSGGRHLVSGDSEGLVRIWNSETLAVEKLFAGHSDAVRHLRFSPDGSKIAAGGDDSVVSLWNLETGEPVVPLPEAKAAVVHVEVGADDLVVVHEDGALRWWSLESGDALRTADPQTTAAAFHPSVGWVLGTSGGSVQLNNKAPKHWRSHDGAVRRLTFNPSGDRLVTVHDGDSTLRLWEPSSGDLKVVVPESTLGGMVEMVAFHPRDPVMAVAGVDWRDGRIVDPKISLSVWEDYVPPKGAVVAKTRAAFQPDGAVVLWDTRDWIIRQVLEGGALRLAFHPSGKCLATVSVDGSVLVWDHVTGEMLFDLGSRELTATDLAFDPTGRYLVAGGGDGALRLWDCKSWRLANVVELDVSLRTLAFDGDYGLLIVGFNNGAAAALRFSDLLD